MYFKSSFIKQLKVGQNVTHNGVCLTVTEIIDDIYIVTAMKETIEKSNLGDLLFGDVVNVEGSLMIIVGWMVI